MERAEQQLRLIEAVYRVESVRYDGEALANLRARCEALLDLTAPHVNHNPRLVSLLDEIRTQVRAT